MSRLVSVIVPTYNRAYCLARTLDSVLAQTHNDLEIVLVDDGSQDETRDLVVSRYGHESRVKYIYRENGGVCAARNTGLQAAQGDYLALLDSDDVWMPWKLQAQLACLDFLPQAGMIWSDMTAIGPNGQVVNPRFLRTMYDAYRWFSTEDLFKESCPAARAVPGLAAVDGSTLYCGDIFAPMIVGNLVHTSTVMLRRERFTRVGGFDINLKLAGEDYDFHFRTCREGPVAFLDVPTIQYQTGMEDRLSQHGLMVAVNFLRTVEKRLRDNRERITLPPAIIRRVLARAHRWAGMELIEVGDRSTARGHLLRSLGYQSWQPRVVAEVVVSMLPAACDRVLRRGYHWIKGDSHKQGRGQAAAEARLHAVAAKEG